MALFRGVCSVDEKGCLKTVVERTAIGFDDHHVPTFTDENGQIQHLDPATPVSMNFWGFNPDYFALTEREFVNFLDAKGAEMKSEFFIPSVVDTLISNGEKSVKVLDTPSQWFGVTYAEDRPGVVERLAKLHADGVYPDKLF